MVAVATSQLRMIAESPLTSKDSAILSALFDPESSVSSTFPISDSTPSIPYIPDTLLPELRVRETQAISRLNASLPLSDAVEAAVRDLSKLIEDYPKYAPAYLNRAQAVRLQIEVSLASRTSFFTPSTLSLTAQVFSDLSSAIDLAVPVTPSIPIPQFQGDILANAYTHRGYLLLKAASAVSNAPPTSVPVVPEKLNGLSSQQLEDLASRDFMLGGRYGNKIARQLSVQTNPYAKACGAIVKEALRKEREEYASVMQ